jgi:ribonuclease BN (tRNA processing enzyme)
MKIKVLGAHNTESLHTRMTCLLVDDTLALDAGALTSSLSFEDQLKIKAIFLTHGHYDHLRDIPALGMNLYLRRASVAICTHQAAFDNLDRYFLNHEVYVDFHRRPIENPTLKVRILEPYHEVDIEGYRVLPVPVSHSLPAMGYQISDSDGRSVFYTGDTGADLSETWKHISPKLLFIELTAPNRWEKAMVQAHHLTPDLLKKALLDFRRIKDYLPHVFLVHRNPLDDNEIESEISAVSTSLGISIALAREGMEVQL